MTELQFESKMAASKIPARSPPPPASRAVDPPPRVPDEAAIAAYEHYLRLPELSKIWASRDFPQWDAEPIVKPAIVALEITFRLLSLALSDPRPYSDRRSWERRLRSLAARQIEIVALLSESGSVDGAPIADISAPSGVLGRERSSQEVWKLSGATAVSHTSEASLLPRLAAWGRSEPVASDVLLQIESQMRRCPFTLGLGEPNLAGKPCLEYDLVARPSDLHAINKPPSDPTAAASAANRENQVLFTIHQIFESWLFSAQQLLDRIESAIERSEFDPAGEDCWILELIWALLAEVEELHLAMDPDDFLRLKCQLDIQAAPRSRALLEVTDRSKALKHGVPKIVGAEVDPTGGPRVQEAAMRLFHSRRRGEAENASRIHLLQGFQAVEAAVKKFFFVYRQAVTVVMGSLEANGNKGLKLGLGLGLGLEFAVESGDTVSQMFMDPPYFPSLDAAKTFLGEMWRRERGRSDHGLDDRCGTKQ